MRNILVEELVKNKKNLGIPSNTKNKKQSTDGHVKTQVNHNMQCENNIK